MYYTTQTQKKLLMLSSLILIYAYTIGCEQNKLQSQTKIKKTSSFMSQDDNLNKEDNLNQSSSISQDDNLNKEDNLDQNQDTSTNLDEQKNDVNSENTISETDKTNEKQDNNIQDSNKQNSQNTISETENTIIPQKCDSTTIVSFHSWEYESIEKKCPNNYAIIALDDNTSKHSNMVTFACCPLPATNIIDYNQITKRSYSCGQDEIMIGAQGGKYNIICAKINTQQYYLGNSSQSCYAGDGVKGKGSAQKCTSNYVLPYLNDKFGKDGCFGVPFGALFVKDSGRHCDSKSAAVLYNKKDNKPVPMFK